METYSKILLAFLLLILVTPQVGADEPPENGPYIEYYENKKKKVEGHYKNGKRDGLANLWHENGKKQSETHYKNGIRDGHWIVWHENGQKKNDCQYKDGKLVAWTTWSPDGLKVF